MQSERYKEMSPTNSVKGENKTGLGLYRIYLIPVLAVCSDSHGMSTSLAEIISKQNWEALVWLRIILSRSWVKRQSCSFVKFNESQQVV